MIRRLLILVGVVAAAVAAIVMRRQTEEDEAFEREMAELARDVPPLAASGDTVATGDRAASPDGPDDLQAIKGIGAVSAGKLADIGVTSFEQIAEWSAQDIADIAARITVSPQRIRREDWVGQARGLSEDRS